MTNREFPNTVVKTVTGAVIFKIDLSTLPHSLRGLLQTNGHGMKIREKKLFFI
jgi:hypothetical protein